MSTLQGVEAVKAVLEAKPGDASHFISVIENKIVRKPLLEAVATTKAVADAIENKDFQKAIDLRGSEFSEYYDDYMTTTATDQPGLKLPGSKVSPSRFDLFRALIVIAANEHCHNPCRCPCWRDELCDSSSSSLLSFARSQTVGHPQWLPWLSSTSQR